MIVVKNFASKLSSGYDGISNKIWKQCICAQAYLLCKICNKSFTLDHFPDIMKIVKIVPVFKSEDKADIKHYRPILLLLVISKVLEKFVWNRLIGLMNKHNCLNIHQLEFRP